MVTLKDLIQDLRGNGISIGGLTILGRTNLEKIIRSTNLSENKLNIIDENQFLVVCKDLRHINNFAINLNDLIENRYKNRSFSAKRNSSIEFIEEVGDKYYIKVSTYGEKLDQDEIYRYLSKSISNSGSFSPSNPNIHH